MAIHAEHAVNVVGAFPVHIGGIHGHNIQVAAADCRVTGPAGIPGVVGVSSVTGPAAYSLMHTHRGTVVPGPRLVSPVGGMALDADVLQGIIGNQYRNISIIHVRFPELICTEVHPVGADIQARERITLFPFIKNGERIVHGPGAGHGFIFHMYGVTGQAGNHRLACFFYLLQLPGPRGGKGLQQVGNGPVVIHAVTAETIGIGPLHGIVLFVQKDIPIAG